MVREYLLLVLVLAYPIVLGFYSMKPRKRRRQRPLTLSYLIGIAEQVGTLLLLLLIDWRSFIKIDFDVVGRGVLADKENLANIITLFFLPLIFSLLPPFKKTFQQKGDDLYGFPVSNMPSRYSELSIFGLYMIASVVFEELFFRQVGFYALNATFSLKGDLLLIIVSALFAFAHHQTTIRAIFSHFFAGLLFGKAYQITGTILWPMALHLLANLPLIVLALRRIKKQYI